TSWLVATGPRRRSFSSTFAAIAATCSGVTGRFLIAFPTPLSTFARSNGSREPSRFTTTTPTWSRRSYVVNRRWHRRHSRRRRIAAPSSAERESTTRSSGWAHHGHRIGKPPRGSGFEAEPQHIVGGPAWTPHVDGRRALSGTAGPGARPA